MCMDFADLNTTYHKDPYPLPNIDCLIDGSLGYRILSFIDAYSKYSQIKMNTLYVPDITFMSNHDNYNYNVIPFSLENADITYQ